MTPAEEARRFLRARRLGMLATVSRRLGGYPFGSVAPFLLDAAVRPLILISTLAEHTKNLDADPRASLLVSDFGNDVQAEARLTLVGDFSRLEDQETPKPRYLRYFPNAAVYFETHDFFFYRMEPADLRYIGGFGDVHWIAADRFHPPEGISEQEETAILDHMNQDHQDALRGYCRHHHGSAPLSVEMIGMDCDGFDLRADERLLRFEFPAPVLDRAAARAALVDMARQARS